MAMPILSLDLCSLAEKLKTADPVLEAKIGDAFGKLMCVERREQLAQASEYTVKYWRGKNMNRKTRHPTVTLDEPEI
jgi:hypothetical protein